MNDELATVAGEYEELVGKLQEKYGIAKEEARHQMDKYKRTAEQLKKLNHELIIMQKTFHKKKSGRISMKLNEPSRK
ncbi:MAG: hypothetical protein NTX44_02875 [Ignavibacteriales bacterium]|nr:hypothetical protein [Ignavibacteriales bacterium]